MTATEERINELFDELVPFQGKCETLAGEIIRAFCRINYRFFNDGDRIGIGYGNETCNAPARFLSNHCNDEIKKMINSMWGEFFDDYYESKLDTLSEMIVEFIENNPDLRNMETEDMFKWADDKDYDYDEEDEYDDWGEDDWD